MSNCTDLLKMGYKYKESMAQLQQPYIPQCGLQYDIVHCRHDKGDLLGVCRTSKVRVHSFIRVFNCQILE